MKIGACLFIPWLALFPLSCSGGSGGEDGGDGGGGGDTQRVKCGASWCAATEICVGAAVCVSLPTQTAKACQEDHDNIFKEVEDADLTCHNRHPCPDQETCPQSLSCKNGFCGIAAPAGAGLPSKVTFRGCVDAFGLGDVTAGMKLALFRASDDLTASPLAEVSTFQDKEHCEYQGAFEFSDVPTNTPLVLKSWDDRDSFVKVYKHNLILWADLATQEGGNWVFDTRNRVTDPRTGKEISLEPWRAYAISQATYDIILMAVRVQLGETEGAIAGTLRDCQYRELSNVRCATYPPAQVVTYFTNAENPRPDASRNSTNLNGIYAAIGLPQGTQKLACVARNAAGEDVPLGVYQVQVLPHAISVLSFDWYPALP